MIYYLKDGPTAIGYGRTLEEAIDQAVKINRRMFMLPSDVEGMKKMIDAGVIKVREIP